MYWIITYSWQGNVSRVLAHEAYCGSIAEWLTMALDQPEDWILINHAAITADDYNKFKGLL